MVIEVKVPLLPESVADATVANWYKKAGDKVSRDENIVDLETDKVMLEVPAPADGVIKEIKKPAGSTVLANEVIAIIDAAATEEVKVNAPQKEMLKSVSKPVTKPTPTLTPAPAPTPTLTPASTLSKGQVLSPSARRAQLQHDADLSQEAPLNKMSDRLEKRVPMTRMRARIAERLLEVAQTTAMLTTFNEINMGPVMEMRKLYREKFEKKYNIRLGLMSFFVRAAVESLKRSPVVNASIDKNDIVYHGYYDIGVAVSTERGLVVPVLRDADRMSMADIEMKIAEYAEKAKNGKLTLEEMQGGTFTITNGGVFGSLMATPLLNAPQCAILGMHKIEDRPVVVNGEIAIRPMMYVALSYDHRLIDGKESVTFLVTIKELLEDPTRILLEV